MNANTSACIMHSDAEAGGWRASYTLFTNLTNLVSLINTHTHTGCALFPRYQATPYHFGKANCGCCLLLVKPRHRAAEREMAVAIPSQKR